MVGKAEVEPGLVGLEDDDLAEAMNRPSSARSIVFSSSSRVGVAGAVSGGWTTVKKELLKSR